jgi:hypothetical protein
MCSKHLKDFHGTRHKSFAILGHPTFITRNSLINSMERTHYWEAKSPLSSLKICRHVWQLKVRYGGHKNPPLSPILSYTNPVGILTSCTSKIHTNVILHLRLGLPSCLYFSGILTKSLLIIWPLFSVDSRRPKFQISYLFSVAYVVERNPSKPELVPKECVELYLYSPNTSSWRGA